MRRKPEKPPLRLSYLAGHALYAWPAQESLEMYPPKMKSSQMFPCTGIVHHVPFCWPPLAGLTHSPFALFCQFQPTLHHTVLVRINVKPFLEPLMFFEFPSACKNQCQTLRRTFDFFSSSHGGANTLIGRSLWLAPNTGTQTNVMMSQHSRLTKGRHLNVLQAWGDG